jgi:hypothetical protein
MLSVASRYLGRVDASDSKREYLRSIVGFMPLVIWRSVTETSKVVDVMLPLGRKQYSCIQGHFFVYITHFA